MKETERPIPEAARAVIDRAVIVERDYGGSMVDDQAVRIYLDGGLVMTITACWGYDSAGLEVEIGLVAS